MKQLLTITTLLIAAATTTHAQTAAQSIDKPFIHPKWTGVWQGKLGGIPSLELTLANDAGQVNGTLVFHAIKNDNGHAYSFSTEPHTLIHPEIQGDKLSFQVIRGNGSNEVLHMTAELNQEGKVHFACQNCGPNAEADLEPLH